MGDMDYDRARNSISDIGSCAYCYCIFACTCKPAKDIKKRNKKINTNNTLPKQQPIMYEPKPVKAEPRYQYNRRKTNQFPKNKEYPYQLKPHILSYNEGRMYRILEKYCRKNHLLLISKIRMADFIDTIHTKDMVNEKEYTDKFYKISSKHVDFLICDPDRFCPLVAIELDDSTHLEEDRQERDEFVDKVYKSVDLPILHFWSSNDEAYINNALNSCLSAEYDISAVH